MDDMHSILKRVRPYLSAGEQDPFLENLGASVIYERRGTICILRSKGFCGPISLSGQVPAYAPLGLNDFVRARSWG